MIVFIDETSFETPSKSTSLLVIASRKYKIAMWLLPEQAIK